MVLFEKNGYSINFDEKTASARFSNAGGISFGQVPSSFVAKNIKTDENGFVFTVDCNNVVLNCRYEICTDETGTYFNLDIQSDSKFDGMVRYPSGFKTTKGDRIIEPYCEGIAFNAEDTVPIPEENPLFGGSWNSMSFWTLANGSNWIMMAVETNADAYFIFEKNSDGLYCPCVQWQDEMGAWGYIRTIRFYIGNGNPVTGCAKTYRKMMVSTGKFKTLADKAKDVPAIDGAIGSAIVWLWNDDAMSKLYDANVTYTKPSEYQYALRRKIADDMKNSGMDDVLWSIFDENVDKETVEYIKFLGYTTSMYQIYTDVMPKDSVEMFPEPRVARNKKRLEYWPDGLMITKEGEPFPAWELTGKDGKRHIQHRMCDAVALDWIEKAIPEEITINGIEGVLMDVCWCCTLECRSKVHPQSRRQAIANKQKIFERMKEMGIVRGTENGHEDSVCCCEYNEGMMSPSVFRSDEAGRRMTHVYDEANTDGKILKYMLNPCYRVPLWELVYHDCQAAHWYWGDSSNSMPKLAPLRDAFDVLYATAPLYSFNVSSWNNLKNVIVDSYRRTVPGARKLRYAEMVSFEYLTNDMQVQKTVFDDGTEIVANFGENEFVYNETVLEKWNICRNK